MTDTYKTISHTVENILYKDKGSKFIAYAFPVETHEDIQKHINTLKEAHPKATHHCYAWQFGTEGEHSYRYNDDGEPSNSAGAPIYGQIQSFELTNILIVVIRYYGGTKLGVRGLINAYKTAAKMAIEEATQVTKIKTSLIKIRFDYTIMNSVQRIIKANQLKIVSQILEENCTYTIEVRNKEASNIKSKFNAVFGLTLI